MDFLSRRQNVVKGDHAELNAKFAAIANAFGEGWLRNVGNHPLQRLWQRIDALATNELLNFGDAVERFKEESPVWLKSQIAHMKYGDHGQVAGALFEVLALNLFSRDSCKVIPAQSANPGFDGTLLLKDGSRVIVSVKNHGLSEPEHRFLALAKKADVEFQSHARASGVVDPEIRIGAHKYLSAAEWKSLDVDIRKCIGDIESGVQGGTRDWPYTITLKTLTWPLGQKSSLERSSSFLMLSPMAQNEQVNFEDAIRRGCKNFVQQTVGETGDVCRMIVIRLSNSASVARCCEWAKWYFS